MDARMGQERAEKARKHMQSLGTAEGISFDFGGKTGNSRLSHQLMHLAKSKGLETQNTVAQELFRLHFEEQRDIADIQTLVEAGVIAGLENHEILEYLEKKQGAEEVDREAAESKRSVKSGVPQFVFEGGKYSVDGAGDAMDFFELIVTIKGETA